MSQGSCVYAYFCSRRILLLLYLLMLLCYHIPNAHAVGVIIKKVLFSDTDSVLSFHFIYLQTT